jgi:hypothetical protein
MFVSSAERTQPRETSCSQRAPRGCNCAFHILVVHSAFFIHPGGAAETSVRNDTCPQAKAPLCLYAHAGALLYKAVVPDKRTGRLIFRSKRRAEHSHDKADNIVIISFVRCTQFCILMYLMRHRNARRLVSTTFPVRITSSVHTEKINLPEC